jgi:hypothetical protein
LAERRKNFPTKARIEARKAAEDAQKKEDKAASLQKEADKLRRQLEKVESSIKRKREQGDEGDEMRGPEEMSSDDDEPESISSRPKKSDATGSKAQNQAKKAGPVKQCKYYATGGKCGKKGKCRFAHDPEVREAAIKEREANNGRLTIQQRLILNDKEQEDLAVLQSIQYLREKGIMPGNKPEHRAASEESSSGEQKAEPVATLPLAPTSRASDKTDKENSSQQGDDSADAKDAGAEHVKQYEGWLLEPYGASGPKTKSGDLP